jgi:hypothetical protein
VSHPSAPDGRSRPPRRDGGGWPGQGADDAWGPSTAVYSGSAKRVGRAFNPPSAPPHHPDAWSPRQAESARQPDAWAPAGPVSGRDQRATRAADRRTDRSMQALRAQRAPERGLPWWGALLVLILIAAIGGVIDTLGSFSVRGGFNFGIVAASIVAILLVKRSHMFPIVIAPPIVYSAAALFQLYIRSSGLHDKKVVLDAAANYLVYGFPAIAAATAAVLIIAGIRLIARK